MSRVTSTVLKIKSAAVTQLTVAAQDEGVYLSLEGLGMAGAATLTATVGIYLTLDETQTLIAHLRGAV